MLELGTKWEQCKTSSVITVFIVDVFVFKYLSGILLQIES